MPTPEIHRKCTQLGDGVTCSSRNSGLPVSAADTQSVGPSMDLCGGRSAIGVPTATELTNIWIRFSKGRSHALRRSDHAQLNRNPLERAARLARAGSAKDSAGRQLFGQGLEDSTLRKFSMMLLGPAGPGKTLAKYGPYSVAELPPNELVVPGINGPPRLHRHLCSSACVV